MIFRRALIRLTLTYTLVQLALFGIFALGVYSFVTGAFDFDVSQLDGQPALPAVEQGFANLRTGLITGYALLVVLLPVSSYLMARGALAPVQRSYELQQRFVDGASHEFRSPLSVIQGELELALARSRTAAEYRAAMMTALDAAQGLTRLTNDLLLLTREDADELRAIFEPVALGELAREAADALGPAAARVSVVDSEVVVVTGSRELLARAIANLLDNAVKFTEDSGRIDISISSTGRLALVVVADDGVGMAESETARAFDRFWRAQDARSTPGFGLGLPLVRQIVSAHGGRVTITSAPGSGTSVTLALPEPLTLVSRSSP